MGSLRTSALPGSLKLALLAALATVALLTAPGSAAAEPDPGPAAWIYQPDAVNEIDLSLPQTSIDELEAEPDEYQPGTFSISGSGGDYGPLEVGIRLKGSGTFRPLTEKAAFKVKFNEYVDDQTLLGLKKLTLNNLIHDESMVHEILSYEAFRAAGLPSSRAGYAFVSVNGDAYGVYANVETLDLVSLARWFPSTRHLYEGGYRTDVIPGGAAAFEVDEGKNKDRTDLEALIAAANDGSGDWSEGMAGIADLEEMTANWAVERYIGHWDGYTGLQWDLQPNNYYLHSETSGLFRMLPWGVDQTWETRLPFTPESGVLYNRCLGDESCAALFRAAVVRVRNAIDSLDLYTRLPEIAAAVRPWQVIDPRREQSMTEIDNAVARTRDFIKRRPADVAAWLGEIPPGPVWQQAVPTVPPGTDHRAGKNRKPSARKQAARRHRKCKKRQAQAQLRGKRIRCPRGTRPSAP